MKYCTAQYCVCACVFIRVCGSKKDTKKGLMCLHKSKWEVGLQRHYLTLKLSDIHSAPPANSPVWGQFQFGAAPVCLAVPPDRSHLSVHQAHTLGGRSQLFAGPLQVSNQDRGVPSPAPTHKSPLLVTHVTSSLSVSCCESRELTCLRIGLLTGKQASQNN